jgi:hypothetical protein
MREARGPGEDTQARVQGEAPQAQGQSGDYQALADALIGGLAEGRPPEEVALALAVLLNRAGTRLHNLTRAEANARKGQPAWPAWAQLQNASRILVLQASTCRDLAARLAGRRQ